MILAAEIALLFLGIYAFVTGRFTLTRRRVVYGGSARVLGVLAAAPMGLALALVFFFVRDSANESMRSTIAIVEAGSILACTALIYIIGWPIAGPPWIEVSKEMSALVSNYKAEVPVVTRKAADVPFMARVHRTLAVEEFNLSDPLFYRRKEIALIADRLHSGIEEFYLFIECDALDWEALIDLSKDTWDYAWTHRNPRSGLSQVLGGHLYTFAIAICKNVEPAFAAAVENHLPVKHDADDYEALLIYDATNQKLHYFKEFPAELSKALRPIQELIQMRLEAVNTESVNANLEMETATC